jgi:hypothetical protein
MPDVELQGVVVAQDPNNPLPSEPSSFDGLYLQTDDGRLLELVGDSMATQMPIDVMWRRSRGEFEVFLGQQVTVQGYLSRRTIYSARIKEPLPGERSGKLPG